MIGVVMDGSQGGYYGVGVTYGSNYVCNHTDDDNNSYIDNSICCDSTVDLCTA